MELEVEAILGGPSKQERETAQRVREKVQLAAVEIPFEQLEIRKKMGEGAMGIVFEGAYAGTKVAVKALGRQRAWFSNLYS